MIGSWKWNFILAGLAWLLTLFLSWQNNPFLTALPRSFYCFVIIFLIMYAVRWFLGTFARVNQSLENDNSDVESQVGTHVDMSTPDEEAFIQEALNDEQQAKDGFSPLSPPKLATKEEMSSEKMAEAVRQMTDEEGR